MDIRQLKYFVTIAEEESITVAARKHNMSQPPLSTQLKQMETELGMSLFDRTGKKLRLTPEGALFYEQAKEVIDRFDTMMQTFEDMKRGVRGTMAIGSICSPAVHLLPGLMGDFLKENPDIELQIYEGSTFEIFNLVGSGVIELGIVKEPYDKNVYDGIRMDSLMDADMVHDYMTAVAMPEWYEKEEHVMGVRELQGKPLIIHRTLKDNIIKVCREEGFEPDVLCTTDNVMTSFSWSLRGMGIAVLPFSSCKLWSGSAEGDKLVIRKIDSPALWTHTALIWQKSRSLSSVAQRFVSEIVRLTRLQD